MTFKIFKCRYANKYQAIYPPKCGCEVCKTKWENREMTPVKDDISTDYVIKPETSVDGWGGILVEGFGSL